MIRLKTLILSAVVLGLSFPAFAQDTVRLKMGGTPSQELQIAPGVQLKDGNSGPHIQIIEVTPEKKPFDEVKLDLQKAVGDYLKVLDTDEARHMLDELRTAKANLEGREAEFKALPVKDEAVIEAWTQTLFNDFDAYRKLVGKAVQFEAAASDPVNRVIFSAHEKDLASGRDEITKILEPTTEINAVWEAVLNEAKGIVSFVIQDSTPIYQDLVTKGEPQNAQTSDKTLKIYFGIMLNQWAQPGK